MSNYLNIIGDRGNVLINDEYKNFMLSRKIKDITFSGYLANGYKIVFDSDKEIPFIRLKSGGAVGAFIADGYLYISSHHLDGDIAKPKGTITVDVYFLKEAVIEKCDNYGLECRNADGKTVYHSNYKFVNFLDCTTENSKSYNKDIAVSFTVGNRDFITGEWALAFPTSKSFKRYASGSFANKDTILPDALSVIDIEGL